MANIKLICFDFDGTIVDSMPILEKNAVTLFTKFHPTMAIDVAVAKYRSTTGLPFEQQVEIIFPKETTNKQMITEFEDLKIETIFKQELFKETKEVLQLLKSKGFLSAISSSTFKKIIDEYLKQKELSKLVDIVLGYRPGFEKGKDHFEFLMNKFSLPPESICYVGDSLKDMERAVLSKVKFIGRTSVMNDENAFTFEIKGKGFQKFNTIDNLKGLLPLVSKNNLL